MRPGQPLHSPLPAERSGIAGGILRNRRHDAPELVDCGTGAERERGELVAVKAVCQGAQQRLPRVGDDTLDDQPVACHPNGDLRPVLEQDLQAPPQGVQGERQGRVRVRVDAEPVERNRQVHQEPCQVAVQNTQFRRVGRRIPGAHSW